MFLILLILYLIEGASTDCENSKAVKLGEMLQDVLDLNSTVQALVEIIHKQVTTEAMDMIESHCIFPVGKSK